MKKLRLPFRSSFSRNLSFLAVVLACGVFYVALYFMFEQARSAVKREAIAHANEQLDNTVQRVNSILTEVEVATTNTLWYVSRQLNQPDSMLVYAKAFMESNPKFQGCAIAFEPYYFKEYGRYFAPYAGYDQNNEIITVIEGSPQYEYFYMDWYQMCKLLDRPSWTDPFMDVDEDIDDEAEIIVSYSIPIKDNDGNFIGTISSDLSLKWLSETISAVKPYPNSYSLMIGRSGTYFVHPDPSKLLYESIFTETLENDNPERMALGQAMVHGEDGFVQTLIDGEPCYVFYEPLGETGWSVAIVCPEKDIFAGLSQLKRAVIILLIIGALVMLLVLSRIIQRQLRPIVRLAAQTETIAAGEFDKTLPDANRKDEIGRLYQSFSHMQQSLVGYIDQVKRNAAAQASIENELKVASEIQMSMVPRRFPERDDVDLYASMTPAKDVGGDLYDFFIHEDKLYFCVGDVSGKGVPASLFMAVTRNLFRIIANQGYSPEVIAEKLNHALAEENEQGMFVTMFIGIVDLKTGRLDYCNCGHNHPVICEPGKPARYMDIKYTNIALGMLDGMVFQGEHIDDIRGWQMLVYTDGLNEAENPSAELFGKERVFTTMNEVAGLSSKEVIERIRAEVERHRNGAIPSDDLTLLCLKLLS